MKSLKITAALAAILFSAALSATDIAGHRVFSTFSYEQIVSAFGKPAEYYAEHEHDGQENFIYEGFTLTTMGQQVFGFNVKKRGVKTLTTLVSGGLQVGDSFTRASSLKAADKKALKDGTMLYRYYYADDTVLVKIFVKDNKIVQIIVDSTVL